MSGQFIDVVGKFQQSSHTLTIVIAIVVTTLAQCAERTTNAKLGL